MILSAEGTPQPPTGVVARLQRIDPDLDVRWMPCGPDPRHSYFAIVYKWRANDERWRRVQSGAIPESQAFDILTMLPLDCSVEQAYSFFVNNIRATTRDGVRHLLDRIHLYNEQLEEEQWRAIEEPALEYVESRAPHTLSKLGIRPMSAGGLPDAPNPIEQRTEAAAEPAQVPAPAPTGRKKRKKE